MRFTMGSLNHQWVSFIETLLHVLNNEGHNRTANFSDENASDSSDNSSDLTVTTDPTFILDHLQVFLDLYLTSQLSQTVKYLWMLMDDINDNLSSDENRLFINLASEIRPKSKLWHIFVNNYEIEYL